ncbi:hypothetical protein DITRI_Ditri01bG0050700 [Diplodiscus trichospermus]
MMSLKGEMRSLNVTEEGEENMAINSEKKEMILEKSDWRKLFAASASQSLQFFPPQDLGDRVIVAPLAEVFEEGVEIWRNVVMAKFIGKIPNFSLFQRLVNVLWGNDGQVDIRPVGVNVFIIQFLNSPTRDWVLESGPWHIQNKPIIVRKWEPGLRSLEFNLEKIPVWIQLGNLPLELFTQRIELYCQCNWAAPIHG